MSAVGHIRYYLYFRRAIPNFGVGWSRVTHPSATRPCGLVRLACVRHAASVNPEPGSNSPSLPTRPKSRRWQRIYRAPSQGACGHRIVSTLQLSRCRLERPRATPHWPRRPSADCEVYPTTQLRSRWRSISLPGLLNSTGLGMETASERCGEARTAVRRGGSGAGLGRPWHPSAPRSVHP